MKIIERQLSYPSMIKWIINDANTITHPHPPLGTLAPGTALFGFPPLVILMIPFWNKNKRNDHHSWYFHYSSNFLLSKKKRKKDEITTICCRYRGRRRKFAKTLWRFQSMFLYRLHICTSYLSFDHKKHEVRSFQHHASVMTEKQTGNYFIFSRNWCHCFTTGINDSQINL